jgi:formate dehydrogenase iron-sulfur subunit
MPIAGRDRSVHQRHCRLRARELRRLRLLREGVPFNIPRISKVDHTAYKCTLCSDRVAVGLDPACQKAYPTQAIVFGTKEEMKGWADIRIKDLKSRGFKNHVCY